MLDVVRLESWGQFQGYEIFLADLSPVYVIV